MSRSRPGSLNSPELTEQVGRLPDFIIIGAMKSGTTSLFRLLQRHPQVFMCTPKEPQFFSRDHVYARGERWYRSLFANARAGQICGEASTCYTRWPHFGDTAGRIAKHLRNVRMIYLMRHPVERAYSHYGHVMHVRRVLKQGPIISLEEALASVPEIIDASLYLEQIKQYLRRFDREQLLFLTLDDLKENGPKTLRNIQEFIGVRPLDLLAQGEMKANRWGEPLAHHRLRTVLERVRSAPGLSRVLDVTPKGLRRKARRLVSSSAMALSLMRLTVEKDRRALAPLQAGMRRQLLERFAEPTKQLESFLGRRLPEWFV